MSKFTKFKTLAKIFGKNNIDQLSTQGADTRSTSTGGSLNQPGSLNPSDLPSSSEPPYIANIPGSPKLFEPPRPPEPPNIPESSNARTSNTNWGPLKEFSGVLSRNEVFARLKKTIDEVIQFVKEYEAIVAKHDDYNAFKTQLNALSEDLSRHFSKDMPPSMTICMENLRSAITRELDHISTRTTQDTNTSVSHRYLTAKSNTEDIIKCYRRIAGHFTRLELNASLSIYEIVNKQAIEAQLISIQPARLAFYNSRIVASVHRRKCTPQTRQQIISDILSWKDDINGSNLYWLNGMAGTGKTTIANTLCTILDESLQLGASFFCMRSHPECRDVEIIFPTIAYQLACFSDPFCLALVQELQKDPDLHHQALEKQFENMIATTLRNTANSLPPNIVVIIDALDKCEDSIGVQHILKLVSSRAAKLPIKFLVSGRPEPQLLRHTASTPSQLALHELNPSIVKEDVKTYLREELKPDALVLAESQLEALVEHAGVLFIYAATVVRYIGADGFMLDPNHRLETVLNSTSSPTSLLRRNINMLYGAILSSAFTNFDLEPSDKELIKLVLHTIVCAQEPVSIHTLSLILELRSTNRVKTALHRLRSVVHIPTKDGGPITILHSSFSDYILDPMRAKKYACDAQLQHNKLTTLCFDRIKTNKRQFNICQLESSYIPDEQVPGIEERINQAIPADLLYACQYWAEHLRLGGISPEQAQRLYAFLSSNLLLWMEVLNLKDRISLGINLLERAKKWCQKAECSSETHSLVYDAWRFVTTFSTNPVSRYTPHIHASLLPFWPEIQPLSRYYKKSGKGLVVRGAAMTSRRLALLGKFPLGCAVRRAAFSLDCTRAAFCGDYDDYGLYVWDMDYHRLLGVLQGHTAAIASLAFSFDGTCIASGCYDKTVRVWDLATFSPKTIIAVPASDRRVRHRTKSIAFSPKNPAHLVSGGGEIYVWDTQTGHMVNGPRGLMRNHTQSDTHEAEVVALSPDGLYIASGWTNGAVRVWYTYDDGGQQQAVSVFKKHTGPVYSVAFSPDGKLIVSGSMDGTVRVWNLQTGQQALEPLEGHHLSRIIRSVAFSHDSTSIVSGSSDNTICVWNTRNRRQLTGGPLVGHKAPICSVAISHDGSRVFSISEDTTLCVWDLLVQYELQFQELESRGSLIESVTFSPDGTLIASGDRDGTIRLWDVQSGLMNGNPLEAQAKEAVYSLTFSPDSAFLVSGCGSHSRSGVMRLWDLLRFSKGFPS